MRYIDVLERPDRVREKLRAWAKSDSFSAEQARQLERIGIVLDLTNKEIVNAEDLDLLCDVQVRRPGTSVPEPPEPVRQALPFPLSVEDVHYLADKTRAKEFLTSSAAVAPLFLQTCEAEAANRTGRVKLALLEIVARVAKNAAMVLRHTPKIST